MDQVKAAEQIKASPKAMGILLFLTVLNILNMVDRTLIASLGRKLLPILI